MIPKFSKYLDLPPLGNISVILGAETGLDLFIS